MYSQAKFGNLKKKLLFAVLVSPSKKGLHLNFAIALSLVTASKPILRRNDMDYELRLASKIFKKPKLGLPANNVEQPPYILVMSTVQSTLPHAAALQSVSC